MIALSFIIYLFEASFCLMILFLVYILFFRKETYFNFNRFYLLAAMLFALIIPVIHVNFSVGNLDEYESTVHEIGRFRTNYEQIIALLDPDYEHGRYRYTNYADFESYNQEIATSGLTNNFNDKTNFSLNDEVVGTIKGTNDWKPVKLILLVYFVGAVFFFGRLLLLFFWLFKIIKNNSVIKKNGFKIVLLQGDASSFSFYAMFCKSACCIGKRFTTDSRS
ncbi:MAG: hypothetical protein HC831_04185 [Chloroflexia bacterium]|nr:hypothetical protein [Chloroflexia bacterium]